MPNFTGVASILTDFWRGGVKEGGWGWMTGSNIPHQWVIDVEYWNLMS